ncbi:nucleoside deaminase [Paracoccus limosus]|jgi:tRNA(Arg) A34 adenosine deaminase TadA|uniref:tRNA-specific adenosine deaminase n=1 Tax=Paracoccus limosus TaxID=913252 RepID=A0A844H4V4_9RHOB|nr:nucleoside deaminase [Paracoccus limosus]MTH34594.1 nucleoside deaminase [Paracoccus limosus]
MEFSTHMPEALDQARSAAARGEVPVGAVLVGADGRVLARAGNRTREDSDPTAHAEILAIRAACAALGSERLPGAQLWVTLEPCPMCAAAISAARIAVLYYGADDPRMGGVRHGARVFDHPQCHHRPEIIDGISAEESRNLLQDFFRARRGAGTLARDG